MRDGARTTGRWLMLCGGIALAAALQPVQAQEATVPTKPPEAAKPGKLDPHKVPPLAIAKSAPPPAPDIPEPPKENLSCLRLPDHVPHMILTAKIKQQDNYHQVTVGCIPFGLADTAELDAAAVQSLDAAADYLLTLNDLIRIYVDMVVPPYSSKETEKSFRLQAFKLRNYLTEKGVYSHMKNVRKAHFTDPFAPKSAPATAAKTGKAAPAPVLAKKPDPSKQYAYHANKSNVTFASGSPETYAPDSRAQLQFLPLESVYFVHDRDELTDRSQATLEAVADFVLRNNSVERVILRAHADETGNANYNYRLTDRRAVSVREYLLESGVPDSLIEVMSEGESAPVDENWTREGRARNRRVEMYLVQRSEPVAVIPATR